MMDMNARFSMKEGKLYLPRALVDEFLKDFSDVDVLGELSRISWWLRKNQKDWVNVTFLRKWLSNSKKLDGNGEKPAELEMICVEKSRDPAEEDQEKREIFDFLMKFHDDERKKRMKSYGVKWDEDGMPLISLRNGDRLRQN